MKVVWLTLLGLLLVSASAVLAQVPGDERPSAPPGGGETAPGFPRRPELESDSGVVPKRFLDQNKDLVPTLLEAGPHPQR